MTGTPHPCAGRSNVSIETFEAIAIGQRPPYRPRVIAGLLRAKLIVQIGEEVIHRDRYGAVSAPVYEVPLPVHYQWCRWASEQNFDEINEESS